LRCATKRDHDLFRSYSASAVLGATLRSAPEHSLRSAGQPPAWPAHPSRVPCRPGGIGAGFPQLAPPPGRGSSGGSSAGPSPAGQTDSDHGHLTGNQGW